MRKLAGKGANKDGAVTDSGGGSDLYGKKADKSAKNGELSTFIGGGERCRKKVESMGDFLKNLPRKEVEVPGVAFSVVIIGRLELKRLDYIKKELRSLAKLLFVFSLSGRATALPH